MWALSWKPHRAASVAGDPQSCCYRTLWVIQLLSGSFTQSVWGAAEAPLVSGGDLLIKHVRLLSAAGEKTGRWLPTREKLAASPLLRRQALLLLLPVSNEGCPSTVAENSKDGSSRPSVGALFMLLVNWPAAVCSREIALSLKYTFSSHTAGLLLASCGFPMASFHTNHCFILFPIICNSSAELLQCLCFSHVLYSLLYQIELYSMHSVPPVHSCISNTCAVFFFSFYLFTYLFIYSSRIHGGATGRNAIVNHCDLGNSFILLPSPNIFRSRTQ